MRILQVNAYESPGRRFHGLAITPLLKEYGIDSQHLVWHKDTKNPDVLTFGGKVTYGFNKLIHRIEQRRSLQSVLYPHAYSMMRMPAFKAADLIHLHIIHSGYMSLGHLPNITAKKPTVWTLHDPWAMTGHCIHPLHCERWRIGCGNCPDLNSHFPLLRDNTRYLFDYKRKAYRKSAFELIVASKWMRDMAESSPLFEGVRIHEVPFGLDLNFFSPNVSSDVRAQFHIADDALVIAFRNDANDFKGLPYILEALKHITAPQPICLLTLGAKGMLKSLEARCQIVELGWVHDETVVRDVFLAADMFLMPSMAEAFGMMAVEALACAKPVIVFEGTSLPGVTFVPDVGIAVPKGDATALAAAIQRLVDNPDERIARGNKGRAIALQYYGQETHVKQLIEVYRSVYERRK